MIHLKKGMLLPISDAVIHLMNEPFILAEAREVAKHCTTNGRNEEEIFENVVPSLAVQYAFKQHVVGLGVRAAPPPPGEFHIDIVLYGATVGEVFEPMIFTDVKTKFDGKFFQQTVWEADKIKRSGDRVLYICISAPFPDKYIFKGVTWSEELQSSDYGCPYAANHLLKDLFLKID